MLLEFGQLGTGGQIENSNFRFLAAGREKFAVRTEADTLHRQMAVGEYAK